MKPRAIAAALAAASLAGSAAPAGAAPEEPLRTLAEVVAYAEQNSPALRAAVARRDAAREVAPRVSALPDPKVSYAYFLENVETRVGPQRQKVGISQTLPLGKRGLRGAVAEHEGRAAAAAAEEERLALRFRLTKLWNDDVFLSRETAITDENARLLAALEDVALNRYSTGRGAHAAVIRAQVERGRVEDRLRSLRDRRRAIVAAINAECGRPPGAPVGSAESDAAYGGGTVSAPPEVEALYENLRANNPRLRALRARVEKARAAERLAGRAAVPDLTLGADYIDTGEPDMPGVPEAGKDPIVARISLSLPLWAGKIRAGKEEAQALRASMEHDLAQAESRLRAELETLHFRVTDSRARAELYRTTLLPQARQSLKVARADFTAGRGDFLDLIDAQRTLLEFELSHERALRDAATYGADLQRLIGAPAASASAAGETAPAPDPARSLDSEGKVRE